MSFWHHGLVVLVIGLMSVAGVGIYITKSRGLQYYPVESSSMAPVLIPGDLSIGKKVEANQLKVGDVITYQAVNSVDIKRVRSIDKARGIITVATDNQSPPYETIQVSTLQALTFKSLPLVGYILIEIRRPLVLIGLIYIPVALFIVREARHLARATWRKPYNISNQ